MVIFDEGALGATVSLRSNQPKGIAGVIAVIS